MHLHSATALCNLNCRILQPLFKTIFLFFGFGGWELKAWKSTSSYDQVCKHTHACIRMHKHKHRHTHTHRDRERPDSRLKAVVPNCCYVLFYSDQLLVFSAQGTKHSVARHLNLLKNVTATVRWSSNRTSTSWIVHIDL